MSYTQDSEYLDQIRISCYKNLLRDHVVAPVRRNASVLAYLELSVAMEAVAAEMRKAAAQLKLEQAEVQNEV